jgi:hypothetical protein
MRLKTLSFAVAVSALTVAGSASATVFYGEMHGVLTQQVDTTFDDPHLKVGDTLALKVQFTDEQVESLNGWPYPIGNPQLATDPSLPRVSFFSIKSSSGISWTGRDDIFNGPLVLFSGGKINAVATELVPSSTGSAPELVMSSYGSYISSSDLYLNTYKTPGFQVKWDYSGSTLREVGSVPEPASWAMMVAGFGTIGGLTRKRRRATQREVLA